MISGFIDTYLSLNESEEQAFTAELGRIEPEAREEVMQIVTSWMRTGIQQGQVTTVFRQLKHKFGELDPTVEGQIGRLSSVHLEELSEALLGFEAVEDLRTWLSEFRADS